MENKRKLVSLSFIIVLLASACLVFIPQASAALTWQTEEIATAGSYPTSICIDPAGTIHLTYVKEGALMYVRQTGDVWGTPIPIVATLSHYATSMAVDSLGNLYIVYEEGGDLKCVQRATSWIWTHYTIDTEGSYFGSYNSISIGSDNLPQVVYHDYNHDVIKYAKWNGLFAGAAWNPHEIDIQHYVGMYCSIAVDSNNKPHVSYHDYQYAALMYAKLVSGTGSGLDDWDVKTLEDYSTGAGFTGYDTSIALDSADKPFISFYDEKAGRLKVLGDPVDDVWKYGIVDSGNFACTDFTINKATNAKYISYYDVANGNLKFATLSGGAWVPQIVDSNEDTGKYSSMALDASGNPHIIYIDETNGKIKHAWLAESVVGTSLTVNYTPDTVDKVAGETATISGKLTVSSTGAAIGGATIHLSYRGQTSMTEGDLGDVVTQPDGTYSYLWTPGADMPNDNYMIRANYEGQVGAYNPSMIMSMPPGLFVVPEYAFGALLAIIAMFAAYAVARKGFSGLASGLGRR